MIAVTALCNPAPRHELLLVSRPSAETLERLTNHPHDTRCSIVHGICSGENPRTSDLSTAFCRCRHPFLSPKVSYGWESCCLKLLRHASRRKDGAFHFPLCLRSVLVSEIHKGLVIRIAITHYSVAKSGDDMSVGSMTAPRPAFPNQW